MAERPEDRLSSLDLIRGVAVLGILPANLPTFAGPLAVSGSREPADRAAEALVMLFVQMKMVTTLALLFGAGLGLQASRARLAEDARFPRKYLWRQFLLFCLGAAHGLLVWFGDILAAYAVLGSLSLGVVLLGAGWVRGVALGALCYVYSAACVGLLVLLSLGNPFSDALPTRPGLSPDGPPVSLLFGPGTMAERTDVYLSDANQTRLHRHGTFLQMLEHRALLFVGGLISLPFLFGWYLLACFLLGVQLLWAGVFHDAERRRPYARLFIVLGMGIGLPCHLAAAFLTMASPGSVWPWFLNLFGALPQALLYLALLLAWNDSPALPWLQERFRAVGRMALTNYLMQSLLCGLVFYGHGLGLYGQVGLALASPLIAAIWLLELWWSPLWLKRFGSGPVEWAWRRLAKG